MPVRFEKVAAMFGCELFKDGEEDSPSGVVNGFPARCSHAADGESFDTERLVFTNQCCCYLPGMVSALVFHVLVEPSNTQACPVTVVAAALFAGERALGTGEAVFGGSQELGCPDFVPVATRVDDGNEIGQAHVNTDDLARVFDWPRCHRRINDEGGEVAPVGASFDSDTGGLRR